MSYKKRYRDWAGLIGVILIGGVLRFWNLSYFGIQGDTALNSFRAFGWFDYLLGAGQTSPIIWYGHIPWWANLAFHDHPPVSFALQFISFKLLGDSNIAALFPSLMAGIGTLLLIYFTVLKSKNKQAAFLSSLFFAIMSYAVWINRAGYLESIVIFFATLSFYGIIKYFEKSKILFLYLSLSSVALSLMTKYTAIFLVPVMIVFIAVHNRRVFSTKRFWFAAAISSVFLLPVTIYNIMVFKTRGHFDAALSSFFGMRPDDYSAIAERTLDPRLVDNVTSFFNSLLGSISLPLLVLIILAFVYTFFFYFRKVTDLASEFALMSILMIIFMFMFFSASAHFVAIVIPFLSVILGIFCVNVSNYFKETLPRAVFWIVIGLIVLGELCYSINSNILSKPFGPQGIVYSQYRFTENGFPKLDSYLRGTALKPYLNQRRNTRSADVSSFSVRDNEVIIFDERILWPPRLWYLERYFYYYKAPVINFRDALYLANKYNQGPIFNFFQKSGSTGVWLIFSNSVYDPDPTGWYAEVMADFREQLDKDQVEPVHRIYNSQGIEEFALYHFTF